MRLKRPQPSIVVSDVPSTLTKNVKDKRRRKSLKLSIRLLLVKIR